MRVRQPAGLEHLPIALKVGRREDRGQPTVQQQPPARVGSHPLQGIAKLALGICLAGFGH
jgi:hypothetical protein